MRVFFLFFLFGCSPKMGEMVKQDHDVFSLGALKQADMYLAMEKCITGSFNLCSDGHEQPYRVYPAFVNLNKLNFLSSYDTIYIFPLSATVNKIRNKGIDCMDSWKMELMFNDSLIYSTERFENSAFCQRVRYYYKKNKIGKEIECQFEYNIYNMKFRYVYGGQKTIILPNINLKGKALIRDYTAHICYITSIDTIRLPL